jgi:hypothetical protein
MGHWQAPDIVMALFIAPFIAARILMSARDLWRKFTAHGSPPVT